MNSKERIKRVIKFANPDRIGLSFNPPHFSDFYDVEYSLKNENADLSSWGYHQCLREKVKCFKGQVRLDDFGNIWGRLERLSKGEAILGALQTDQDDWSGLDNYRMPEIDTESLKQMKEYCEQNSDKYIIGSLPCFTFNIMRVIRGMEFLLADILLNEDEILRFIRIVENKVIEYIDAYKNTGIDAIMFGEDWGTQNSLLISPESWRKIFKPAYEVLVKRIHMLGYDVIMHSCGYIYEILGDLIEVGIDVLQLDQPALMGLERMAENYSGKVTFYSPVDIQSIMVTGDKIRIQNAAKNMIKLLGNHGGGFIAMDYGGWATIDVKEEWAQWARDVFSNDSRRNI